jgi:hypothetical protein
VTALSRRGAEEKVSLVAKVKGRADSLVAQAKTKYAENEKVRKAGKQAGKAAGQAAGRIRQLAAKTTTAVKDARDRRVAHR